MNVVPIPVTPMPCVPTPMVPIHAPAMLETKEMDSYAQVIIIGKQGLLKSCGGHHL